MNYYAVRIISAKDAPFDFDKTIAVPNPDCYENDHEIAELAFKELFKKYFEYSILFEYCDLNEENEDGR